MVRLKERQKGARRAIRKVAQTETLKGQPKGMRKGTPMVRSTKMAPPRVTLMARLKERQKGARREIRKVVQTETLKGLPTGMRRAISKAAQTETLKGQPKGMRKGPPMERATKMAPPRVTLMARLKERQKGARRAIQKVAQTETLKGQPREKAMPTGTQKAIPRVVKRPRAHYSEQQTSSGLLFWYHKAA
jgi:uncharacterized protein YcgL (UPF0745 family)